MSASPKAPEILLCREMTTRAMHEQMRRSGLAQKERPPRTAAFQKYIEASDHPPEDGFGFEGFGWYGLACFPPAHPAAALSLTENAAAAIAIVKAATVHLAIDERIVMAFSFG
jgi:hypothetical protein